MDEVVTVTDDEVAEAMVLLLERSKLVVEGAGAVAVAALMHGRVEAPAEGEVCAVLSGGNVDASLLSECIRLGRDRGAAQGGALDRGSRPARGRCRACWRSWPGTARTSWTWSTCATGSTSMSRETAIKLVLQTRGPEHSDEILGAARAEGFSVRVETRREAYSSTVSMTSAG